LLAAAAALAIFRLRIGMLQTLGAACAAGIALHLAGVI
jgi:chromate transporter